MNQFKITRSDFGKYFLLGLDLIFIVVFLTSLADLIGIKISKINSSPTTDILMMILIGWLIWMLYLHATVHKIILTDEKIIIEKIKPAIDMPKSQQFIPQIIKQEIYLGNIKSVIFAEAKFFKKFAKENNNENLSRLVRPYDGDIPLLYILENNSNQILENMLQFSKKSTESLISAIKNKNLEVIVGKN